MAKLKVVEPAQQRAIQTRERILDTALDILADAGYEALTTNAIAERAPVNIRSIYRYFEDKHAIVIELARRESLRRLTRLGALVEQFMAGAELRTWVDAVLRETSNIYLEDPRSFVLERTVRGLNTYHDLVQRGDEQFMQTIAHAIRVRMPAVGEDQSQAAARIVQYVVRSYLHDVGENLGRVADNLVETSRALYLYLHALEAN